MEYGYGYESAISGAVLMVYWVIMLSLSILAVIGMWKMFVKPTETITNKYIVVKREDIIL